MPTSKTDPQLKLTPEHQNLVAQVTGIDLSRFREPAYARQWTGPVRAAWRAHPVLVFPGQQLDEEALSSFARSLGPLGEEPYLQGLSAFPHIVEVRREPTERAPVFGSGWHSDWSFLARPPAGTMLYGRVIPPQGGDTLFADGYQAFAALPRPLQQQLEAVQAVHSARRPYSPKGFAAGGGAALSMAITPSESAYARVSHPILRTHPESGRTALWLNPVYVIGLEGPGVAPGEDARLLRSLCRHLTDPAFVYRHRWQERMLVLWDNRCVTHRATGGYDGYARLLQRVTIAGEVPQSAEGVAGASGAAF
ncbi:MAG: TauD/TfdA family dioxygenase [Pseudomonadota bacterium]